MENCIFCKIASKEIPSYMVFENETFVCFLDITPIKPGHLLVVPKDHEDKIYDLDRNTFSQLFDFARSASPILSEVCQSLRTGYLVEGFGVAHAHLHLVPISEAAELSFKNAQKATDASLKQIQEKVCKAFEVLNNK